MEMLAARRNHFVLVVSLIFFSGLSAACDPLADMCGNDVAQQTASPDGKLKVVVFERSCGATTGFSTQISVLASDAKLPNTGGNLFSATGGKAELTEKGVLRNLQVKWLSETKILIKYDKQAKATNITPPKGIDVLYETLQ